MDTNVSEEPAASIFGDFLPRRVGRWVLLKLLHITELRQIDR